MNNFWWWATILLLFEFVLLMILFGGCTGDPGQVPYPPPVDAGCDRHACYLMWHPDSAVEAAKEYQWCWEHCE